MAQDFRSFCRQNPDLETHEQRMEVLFGQLHNSGLEPTSIKNYLEFCDSTVPYPARARSVLVAAEKLATDRGGRGHARDASLATIAKVIQACSQTDDEISHAIWVLGTTGLRTVDIARLWDDAAFLGRKNLTVQARWTKGIQKLANRRTVTYPLADEYPPTPTCRALLTRTHRSKKKRLFSKKVRLATIQNRLNEVCKRLGVKRITSGSFRRAFSARIQDYCTKNGIPKKDMMLHVSEKIDQAHYSFDNRNTKNSKN